MVEESRAGGRRGGGSLGDRGCPAQAAGWVHGCPPGYFCIYPRDAGYNYDHPSHFFSNYGWYNLSNMYGVHTVINNQYSEQGASADVDLCDEYNGQWHNFRNILEQGMGTDYDFTPINSIKLYLYGGSAGYYNGCTWI